MNQRVKDQERSGNHFEENRKQKYEAMGWGEEALKHTQINIWQLGHHVRRIKST